MERGCDGSELYNYIMEEIGQTAATTRGRKSYYKDGIRTDNFLLPSIQTN